MLRVVSQRYNPTLIKEITQKIDNKCLYTTFEALSFSALSLETIVISANIAIWLAE